MTTNRKQSLHSPTLSHMSYNFKNYGGVMEKNLFNKGATFIGKSKHA
jgi:hypothetical protein